MTRNVGMHAGGVLIAPGKLTDFCPLYQQPGSDSRGEPVRQGRRRGHRPGEVRLPGPGHADHPGARARSSSSRATRARRTSPSRTSRSTTRASTSCSPTARPRRCSSSKARGMQGMLRDAKPTRLEDLIALNALYRPGPMDLIPSFVRAQARPRGGRVPAPAARAEMLERDLRHHGLPGAGDAGRADPGRLLARRRRPAAPRDGQEEGRGDGRAPRDLPRGRGEEGHRRRRRPTRSST